VILVHNHPSGDPTPSPEDAAVTRQLVSAGVAVGIPVLDHIIVGEGRFVSMAERNGLGNEGWR
jgi:DNA repair protein RadC